MHLQSVEHICHHFWVGATANPPKSDDRYAHLTRGALIINDFLQNPDFRHTYRKSDIHTNETYHAYINSSIHGVDHTQWSTEWFFLQYIK